MRAATGCAAFMIAMAVAWVPVALGPGTSRAQQPRQGAVRTPRGGSLSRTGRHQFEVFCYETGVRVFVSDRAGKAVPASGMGGSVTFYHPNSPDPWFTRPLEPAAGATGRPAESLDLAMDLTSVPRTGVTLAIEVRGMPDSEEAVARFTLPFAIVEVPAARDRLAPRQDAGAASTSALEPVHYFALAGFYQTASGELVWIPAAGYYRAMPVQFYPHRPPAGARGWQSARPVAVESPAPGVLPDGAPVSLQFEPFGRTRTGLDIGEYHARIREEMRKQRAAGRTPLITDRECARCHHR